MSRSARSAPGHRSVSQYEMLARCGQQYAFRYLDGITEPGSLPKAKGSAIHSASQANFEQKIESDRDISLEDFRMIAAEKFDEQVHGDLLFTPAEEAVGKNKSVAQQKDATVALAAFFHEAVSPSYHPIAVEERFEIPLPSAGTTIVGFIDLVDMTDRIVDAKTSKRAKSQAEADQSLQLTTYAAARTRLGRPPAEIVLDTVVQTAGGKTARKTLKTNRGMEDFQALGRRIQASEKIIAAGAFGPAPTNAWWCSPSWCGFWTRCPFVNRTRATGDE